MKTTTLTRLFTTAAVLGCIATPAFAQEEGGSGITAEATLDVVNKYFFRGFEQDESDLGVAIQPGISFTMPVDEGIGLTVGTWGSIHGDVSGGGSNPSSWYEQDVFAGITFGAGDFSFDTGLTYYTYPSSATNADILEMYFTVEWDDSETMASIGLEGVNLNPYATLAVELQKNGATDEAIYLELGAAYALDLSEITDVPVTFSVPVAIGLSIDDYYLDANGSGGDNFLGFISIGLEGTIAMKDLIGTDEWFGAWDLTAGVTLFLLNNDVALAQNPTDDNDNYQFVLSLGLSREW